MGSVEANGHPKTLINVGAKNVPFYTPIQDPPAGTPWDVQPEGSLFSPLKLRGLTLHNRIIVSPMCQYSAKDGYMTPWHKQHLGSFAARGPGLIITEVNAVSPEGRISPQDAGIWEDGQLEPLKEIVDFVHSQGARIAIQMGHAGRKASTVVPWLDRKNTAVKEAGGWPDEVVAPSAIPYSPDSLTPREMTSDGIAKFKQDWVAAVKRALKAGFDAIEIHAAHGYLLNAFLSPASNQRTDQYGGSFENRTRLLLETVKLTRDVVPEVFPLLVRMPGTDYLEFDSSLPQWHIEEAAKLGQILAANGIDLIDISGGGLDSRQKITSGPGYQVPYAAAVKKAVKDTVVAVTSVGMITSGKQAQGYLSDGSVDAVLVGRGFLKDPNLVWHWADELDVDIHVASQYGWGFGMTRTHRHRKY
ncbi:oxidoreductase [Fusarium agapanthi]|uniref:Oxidoreductase n=1 Tax=Fusarium agapanthi TaxID=1803897 RepID=A0A9P5BH99_9HYPO|nr:oxidoreductase [Fusarium agapanthi]